MSNELTLENLKNGGAELAVGEAPGAVPLPGIEIEGKITKLPERKQA